MNTALVNITDILPNVTAAGNSAAECYPTPLRTAIGGAGSAKPAGELDRLGASAPAELDSLIQSYELASNLQG